MPRLAARRPFAIAGIAIVLVAIVVARGQVAPVVRAAAPTLPIRAAFYYPWFPQTWTGHGIYPYTWYTPTLGYYNSSSATTVDAHIAMMKYAGISAGIASWWGIGHTTDQRVPLLLTEASTRNFYWTLYYEPPLDPVATAADLTYIYAQYGPNSNFLHIGVKPVLFIYNTSVKTCADVQTWVTMNANRFYLSPQVFGGYKSCAIQPDTWHQYGPGSAEQKQLPYSFSISAGFWHRIEAAPRLTRDPARWRINVQDMVASKADWQLITTFNEWGEGTAVEDATQWQSCSGYGVYLDELHTNGVAGVRYACGASPPAQPTRSPATQSTPIPKPSPHTPVVAGSAVKVEPAASPPLSTGYVEAIEAALACRAWSVIPH